MERKCNGRLIMRLWKWTLIALLLVCISGTGLIACGCGDDDDDDNSSSDADDDTSDDDADDDTSDDDADDDDDIGDDDMDDDTGDDDEPENQPFGKNLTTLSRVEEVLFVTPGAFDDHVGVVFDDGGEDAEVMGDEIGTVADPLGTDRTGGKVIKILSADVDADGRQEMVVLSLYTDRVEDNANFNYWLVTVIDDVEGNYAVLATIDSKNLTIDELDSDKAFCLVDLAVGDVAVSDGLEIIVSGTYGVPAQGDYCSQDSTILWIFADAASNFAEIHRDVDTGAGTEGATVAAGDLDGDFMDEIILMGFDGDWRKAWALDDGQGNYEQFYRWHDVGGDIFYQQPYGSRVVIANIDGQGAEEAVFFGIVWQCMMDVEAYAWNGEEFTRTLTDELLHPGSCYRQNSIPRIATGDFNGDRKSEFVFAAETDYWEENKWSIGHYNPANGSINRYLGYQPESVVAAGDIDRDMKDEFFIAQHSGDEYRLMTFGDEGEGMDVVSTWTTPAEGDALPAIGVGDVDGDNMVVRYTGNHWLTITDPRITVAMAMPPVWDSIPQDYANTSVGYGESTTYTDMFSTEVTVRASVTASFKIEDPFGIFSAETSLTMSEEFAQTETNTTSTSLGIQRTASWDSEDPDNYVVYAATEYHSYEYEVVSHPDPSFTEGDARIMTIDVPLETQTYKRSIGAFNDGGDYEPIGLETFNHTLGDPESYYTRDERDAILLTPPLESDDEEIIAGPIWDEEMGATGWANPPIGEALLPVDEGTGGTQISVDLSEENSSATSRSLGVDLAVGVGVGGVGFAASMGISNSHVYEVSVGVSTSYYGSVGAIPQEYLADNDYDYGMFVYNYQREDGAKYQIIDWCVER
jgi:hypothetical protein